MLMMLTAQADERTTAQKMAAAKATLAQIMPTIQTRAGGTDTAAEPEVLSEQSGTTVIGYAGGGFAVVANDDLYDAVVGYSTAKYSAEVDGFNWWRERVEATMSRKIAASSGYAIPDGLKTSVSPLITTKWGQSAPYYNQCPAITKAGKTQRCYTGCVATAMAQVMNYHELPAKATGTVTYTNPATNRSASVVLSNVGTYDWANMLDDYSGTYDTPQANAVAKLMFHCGAAVNMTYSTDGSSAYTYDAAYALRTNFGYKTRYYEQGFYTSDELAVPVFQELSKGNPCMFGGASVKGENFIGHEFVLDGYDEKGFVHVNWGWDGDCDGYYDLALLNPEDHQFSSYQELILIGLDSYDYFSQWGMYTFEMSFSDLTLTATDMSFYNIDLDNFTGALKMIAEGNGKTTELAITCDDGNLNTVKNVENLYGFSTEDYEDGTAGNAISVNLASLADGTYTLYPASKATSETTWHPMRAYVGCKSKYVVTISGRKITKAEGVNGSTGISLATMKPTDGTTRVYDLHGRMVYSAAARQFSTADIPATGILIIKSPDGVKKIYKGE